MIIIIVELFFVPNASRFLQYLIFVRQVTRGKSVQDDYECNAVFGSIIV